MNATNTRRPLGVCANDWDFAVWACAAFRKEETPLAAIGGAVFTYGQYAKGWVTSGHVLSEDYWRGLGFHRIIGWNK